MENRATPGGVEILGMENIMIKRFGLVFLLFLTAAFAAAKADMANVVTSCGTVDYSASVGLTVPLTIDTKGNICGTQSGGVSAPVTPADISPSSNLTLVAAGVSQTLIAANACPNFVTIENSTTAAAQGGIAAAESVWVRRTSGNSIMTGGSGSTEIASGVRQSFLASTVAMTWIAATIGHKINAWCE